MGTELRTAIRDEIEHVFGRKISSSRDCIQLSEDIYHRTQQQLNSNTLRRFFGLVKADYPPSKSTLTILSAYCGFFSTEDLINRKRPGDTGELIAQEGLVHYLVSLFCDIHIEDFTDKTFLSLVRQTIRFLNKNAVLADKFQSLVAKTKNGQEFYFEQFVNIDKFNYYYEDGLRYYLNEKPTRDARIFANSVFVYKYWLNDNHERVLRHAKEISEITQETLSPLPGTYITSRYFAALLFSVPGSARQVDQILINIYKYYSAIIGDVSNEQMLYFEYVVSEALILTGHYNDALYYLSQSEERKLKSEQFKYTISQHNFKLLKAVALLKTDNWDSAKKIFDEIKPSEFYFLNKKFSAIMYTYLSNQFQRTNVKSVEFMNSLVDETGFVKLKLILAEA
ncbi:MAG: hypothetical protein H7122_18230 [Chitinophagaceae bacterium]|nr:hypothetical protein [Chitinophagaceae bacterium]